MFPQARALFDDDQLRELGEMMEERRASLEAM